MRLIKPPIRKVAYRGFVLRVGNDLCVVPQGLCKKHSIAICRGRRPDDPRARNARPYGFFVILSEAKNLT